MKPSYDHLPVYSLNNFSSPERKGQQFQVEIFDAKRHFSVKYPHRHDFYEVLYLAQGSGFHVIDSNNYEILPPCIFFMSPGQAHKLEFSQDIEGFIFIFNADFYLLNRRDQNTLIEFPFFYTIQQDNPPLQLESEEDISFIEKLFSQGVAEIKKENYSVEMLRSILDLILTTCASRYKIGDHNKHQGRGHILLKRFYQLVEENYQKNFSPSDYAKLLSVTPNHLTQTVRQFTGKTTIQIIKLKQILEIKRLLLHTNMNISQIASQLNFDDQSYFSKYFKRETQLSPLEFRAKMLPLMADSIRQ